MLPEVFDRTPASPSDDAYATPEGEEVRGRAVKARRRKLYPDPRHPSKLAYRQNDVVLVEEGAYIFRYRLTPERVICSAGGCAPSSFRIKSRVFKAP